MTPPLFDQLAHDHDQHDQEQAAETKREQDQHDVAQDIDQDAELHHGSPAFGASGIGIQ